jgi:hypothetical protein
MEVTMMFAGNYPNRLREYGIILLGIMPVVALVSCQRLSPGEEKIIGTWEFTGLDATGRVVFRRDHTVVDLFPENDSTIAKWAPTAWGKWRLEGNEIVTDEEILPIPGHSTPPRRITRLPIREFGDNRLVRADGRSDFNRVHWGVEQYSQGLALLYLTAGFVALAAAVYAARTGRFRKEFILLAVAAGVAVLWSLLMLVAELAQTGSLIVSKASLRSLRVPRELLRVAYTLMFVIGFVKLTFAVRARPGAKEASSDA